MTRRADQIIQLSDDLAREQQRADDLERQLQTERAASHIASLVGEEMKKPAFQSAVDDEAEAVAVVAVVDIEKVRLVDELSSHLIETEYDEYAATFRAQHGLEIKANLDAVFSCDGTYDHIKAKAEEDTRKYLQAEVLAEAHKKAELAATTPEVQQRIQDDLRIEIEDSKDMQEFRTTLRSNYEKTWRAEVTEAVKAAVADDEQAREVGFKASAREAVSKEPDVAAYRAKIRAKLQKDWTDEAKAVYLASVENEELAALQAKTLAAETERQRKVNIARELLGSFVGVGVATAKILPGSRLEIMLGNPTTVKVEETYKDGYNDPRKRTIDAPGYTCERTLTLVALGEGRFRVDGDSLLDHDNGYVRQASMARGTIVGVGRRVRENGVDKLEPVLTADVPLYIDDHATDHSKLINAEYPVVNVTIDGMQARDIKHLVKS